MLFRLLISNFLPEENTKLSEKYHDENKAKQGDHSGDCTEDIAEEFALPYGTARVFFVMVLGTFFGVGAI